VSAIGHETDQPLLDLVADLAASTPTDAAKRIVPDIVEEMRQLTDARRRIRSTIQRRLATEAELMAGLPERLRRGVTGLIDSGAREVEAAQRRARARLGSLLDVAHSENSQLLARVVSLSPQAVLNRGYAVLWHSDGALVRDSADTAVDEMLRVRVARNEFSVRVADEPSNAD
jgi:exodeoxyribonuclease VII large subunit